MTTKALTENGDGGEMLSNHLHQHSCCFWVPGFFKVLSQLTQTGDVTPEQFISKLCLHGANMLLKPVTFIGIRHLRESTQTLNTNQYNKRLKKKKHTHVVCWLSEKFEHMKKTGDYYVVVVEDTNLRQIVATATLITEHKFIHSCAKVYYIPAGHLCVFNKEYNCNFSLHKTNPIKKVTH